MNLVLVVLVVFVLLLINELWWRRHGGNQELSRKFIHITVGSFVATWPFFLNHTEILLLSGAFLIVVALSRYLHLFAAIHSVQRPTYGELFFAISVGATIMITSSKWVYAAAVLLMSLADGLAALIGIRYGKRNRYKILGQPKSVVGTLTFLVVAVALLVSVDQAGNLGISIPVMLLVAGVSTVIENFGVFGLDNLFVPILGAILLVHA